MGLSPLFALLVAFAALGAGAGWLLCRRLQQAERAAGTGAVMGLTEQVRERETRIETLRIQLTEADRAIARMEGEATRLPELRGEVACLHSERGDLNQQLRRALGELAQVTANLENERRQGEEKLAVLAGAREELTNQFKALANDILEEKSKRFSAENQTSIGHLLDPLKTRLIEFQAKVEEVQKEGIAGRSELKTHIGELKTLNERLSSDATNLVNALKGSSKQQGDWGEFILERILDACGLRKGHEYRVQETFANGDGRRARPDVIIDLRDGRHLVIDAKVSLVDYNDYCNCDDERQREASLGRHMASMRAHLKELSQRNYQSLYGLKSLDFVVMFVPIEPAFMLAIARDDKLWEDAWNKSILLVSPSTLLFVIRTVANLWRQETQARRVQEIVDRGRELYDKLAAFAKDLSEVGSRLNSARDSYDEAVKKLSTGKGNAIRQAEMLKELGVKPTKSLPAVMLDASTDAESETLLLSSPSENVEYLPDAMSEISLRGVLLPASELTPHRNARGKSAPQPSIFEELSSIQ